MAKGQGASAIALSWVVPCDAQLIREIERENRIAEWRGRFPRLRVAAAFREARWLEAHHALPGTQLGFRVWSDDRLRVGTRWSLDLMGVEARGSFIALVSWVEPLYGSREAKFEVGFHVLDGDLEALEYLRTLQD